MNSTADEEILITLISGTFLLMFFVIVVIVAAIRYQNRKQRHLAEMERIRQEAEQLLLKTRLEVHEKTLTDVSREIHDNIGQILSVAKLNLHTLQQKPETLDAQVPLTLDLLNNAIKDLRNLSKVLNTDFVQKQSLSTLLQREVEVINHAQVVKLTLKVQGEETTLPPERQLIIFRIVQECLQNVIKHAKASEVTLELAYEDHTCRLSVEDNGIGFDVTLAKQGNGYTNLMARASILGAKLDTESVLGQGSKISLTVPL
jgi:signal transduction histidine kinase